MEDKKMAEGVKVQLIKNRSITDSTYSTTNGYFEIEVPFNGLYLLRLTKFGYVPKNLEIDTKLGTEAATQNYFQDVILNFEKAPFGLDLTDLDTAMARIYYSPKVGKFIYDESYFISKAVYDNLLMKKIKAQETKIAKIQDELDSLSPAARKALGLDAKEYELKRKAAEWESRAKAEYYRALSESQKILTEAQNKSKKIQNVSMDSIKAETINKNISNLLEEQEKLSEQKYLLEIQRLNVRTRDDSLRLFEKEAELAKQQLSLTEAQSQLEIKQSQLSLQQEKLKSRNRLIVLFTFFVLFLISVLIIIIRVNNQRKKLNKQLRKVNIELERLNFAVSQSTNGIVICNKTGESNWYNKGFTEMLDLEIAKSKSINIFDIIQNQNLKNSFRKNQAAEFSDSYINQKGAEKWLNIVSSPINQHADNEQFILILSNITELKEAQQEIETQAAYLEIQNTKITDSIRYAKKIQNAILYPIEKIPSFFEVFSIFMPKDIVSGDFYFYKKISETQYVFAVADCTGHGVPGAFMSLLSYEKLDKIINSQSKIDPAQALTQLDHEISTLLATNTSDTEDGLEIAMIYLEKSAEKIKLVFSGANRPLIIYHHNERKLDMIKGNKKGIGGKDFYYLDDAFKNQFFYITLDARLYLYSDGLIDLRGNGNKRFGTNNFLDFINKFGEFDANLQKNEIENIIFALISETEQRDDISLISIKLNTEWNNHN
jgi:PAS domain S-box-containing protein